MPTISEPNATVHLLQAARHHVADAFTRVLGASGLDNADSFLSALAKAASALLQSAPDRPAAMHYLKEASTQVRLLGESPALLAAQDSLNEAIQVLSDPTLRQRRSRPTLQLVPELDSRPPPDPHAVGRVTLPVPPNAASSAARQSPTRTLTEGHFPPVQADIIKNAGASAQPVEIDAEIGLQSVTNFFTGLEGDWSDVGLFLSTYSLLPIGTALVVRFVLPGGYNVSTSGRVRWVREPDVLAHDVPPGMGIHLDSLSKSDREAIQRFTLLRPPIFYEGH